MNMQPDNHQITDAQVERAIEYLREHADEYAVAVGLCKFFDHKRKIIRSQAFLNSDLKTIAERQAEAEATPEYRKCIVDIRDAETNKALIATNFKRAELTIDVYRTQAATARRGNI